MTPAQRESLAAQTAAARRKAVAAGPKQISAASRQQLSWLWHPETTQQEPGAA